MGHLAVLSLSPSGVAVNRPHLIGVVRLDLELHFLPEGLDIVLEILPYFAVLLDLSLLEVVFSGEHFQEVY